jgi:hypothetical protein
VIAEKRNVIYAWLFFGLIVASVAAAGILDIANRPPGGPLFSIELYTAVVPLAFSFVGAMILSRQPRNAIGLLMMLPAVSLFFLVDIILRPYLGPQAGPPDPVSPLFLLVLWFSNWNWLLLVFPIMFIMVLFPTGSPLSRRWGWLMYAGWALAAVIVVLATFAKELAPGSGGAEWAVRNPIGFISEGQTLSVVLGPFFLAMPLWVLFCAASLFVRYRRARAAERQQIKWLFYAGALFAAFYVPTFITSDFGSETNSWTYLFFIGLLAIPAGIAIAILRYRLFDIDILIRRTLQYAILTALLALVYFGAVVVLQETFGRITGETQSPLITVISTLAIAALFTPLRVRSQDFIDRRFFRQKYDAEQVLARFAAAARDEVDLESLNAALLGAVDEAIQPEKTSLWLKN